MISNMLRKITRIIPARDPQTMWLSKSGQVQWAAVANLGTHAPSHPPADPLLEAHTNSPHIEPPTHPSIQPLPTPTPHSATLLKPSKSSEQRGGAMVSPSGPCPWPSQHQVLSIERLASQASSKLAGIEQASTSIASSICNQDGYMV